MRRTVQPCVLLHTHAHTVSPFLSCGQEDPPSNGAVNGGGASGTRYGQATTATVPREGPSRVQGNSCLPHVILGFLRGCVMVVLTLTNASLWSVALCFMVGGAPLVVLVLLHVGE